MSHLRLVTEVAAEATATTLDAAALVRRATAALVKQQEQIALLKAEVALRDAYIARAQQQVAVAELANGQSDLAFRTAVSTLFVQLKEKP